MQQYDEPPMRVGLPADVERPDTIIGGFTARQVAILAATGVLLWLAWAATADRLPVQVFLAIATPVGLVGFALAVVRRDGIGLDAWLLAAIRHRRGPKTMVSGSTDTELPPAWVRTNEKVTLPAPLRLPAKGITDGVIDLGPDGSAALVGCSTVNLHLRSTAEQHGLVAAFARWLNSIDTPVQILIRSRRVDLAPMAKTITAGAAELRDPFLEAAARRHADFLVRLAAERELLHRQVTVVCRDRRSPVHAAHRAAEAARALTACEISTQLLDSGQTAATLAECASAPDAGPTVTAADAVIHARSNR